MDCLPIDAAEEGVLFELCRVVGVHEKAAKVAGVFVGGSVDQHAGDVLGCFPVVVHVPRRADTVFRLFQELLDEISGLVGDVDATAVGAMGGKVKFFIVVLRGVRSIERLVHETLTRIRSLVAVLSSSTKGV